MKRNFTCSWHDCRRSFGKAEHLQRHERSRKHPGLSFESIAKTADFDATDTGDARHECPVCQKRFTRRYKLPCVTVMTRLTDSGCQRRNDKTCCPPWRGFHSDQESAEGVMVCERPLTRQLSHSLLANHVSLPNFVVTDSLVQHVEDVCIQAGHVLIEQQTAQLQFPLH